MTGSFFSSINSWENKASHCKRRRGPLPSITAPPAVNELAWYEQQMVVKSQLFHRQAPAGYLRSKNPWLTNMEFTSLCSHFKGGSTGKTNVCFRTFYGEDKCLASWCPFQPKGSKRAGNKLKCAHKGVLQTHSALPDCTQSICGW